MNLRVSEGDNRAGGSWVCVSHLWQRQLYNSVSKRFPAGERVRVFVRVMRGRDKGARRGFWGALVSWGVIFALLYAGCVGLFSAVRVEVRVQMLEGQRREGSDCACFVGCCLDSGH